jgi:hypothetical protein
LWKLLSSLAAVTLQVAEGPSCTTVSLSYHTYSRELPGIASNPLRSPEGVAVIVPPGKVSPLMLTLNCGSRV